MDWTPDEIDERSDATVVSRTTFNDPRDSPPSIAIAVALAELDGTPLPQTDFTLADEIDPDALDDLVTDDAHDARVTFTVNDYLVVARSDGMVQIRDIEE